MTLFNRLQSLIAGTLKVPVQSITESTTHEHIPANWDSLGQVNLVMAIEETFGVYIEPEHFDQLKSVAAIMTYLQDQGVD